jgi:SpoVK/Ycf46/Vps4 family AAA+-type ATPase
MRPDPASLAAARQGRGAGASETAKLRSALGSLAEVRAPGEAEEPILAPHARAALFEWLAELRAAAELRAVGLKPRATALLHGPPGCGKTTLAHHLAARLGIPMVQLGAEHINSSAYFGEAERGVTRIFGALAQADVRCVVFMDEMEGWGGKRDQNRGGGADNARTSLLGVLLRRIETFEGILMGATNRPQDIDPALWRRFNMQLGIDLSGEDERFAILRRYLAPFALDDEAVDALSDALSGASPALLRAVAEGIKRALILAPRLNRSAATPAAVLGPIIAAVRPPPEIPPPPLWADTAGMLAMLDTTMAWPPTREALEKPTEPKGEGG